MGILNIAPAERAGAHLLIQLEASKNLAVLAGL